MDGCATQLNRVVADADEERRRRPLAQSNQVAPSSGWKLTGEQGKSRAWDGLRDFDLTPL
jgi:hypothetical protein